MSWGKVQFDIDVATVAQMGTQAVSWLLNRHTMLTLNCFLSIAE